MSGHSKWANIKHKKGAADARKAAVFTKLAKNITVAAKNGGDPDFNFSLRTAINAALNANMTKDAVERAVRRGTGDDGGGQIEEVTYEGFGPGGVAVIVEALTDNRNRTAPNIRHVFGKHGGNMGATGSVQWMFDRRGVVRAEGDGIPEDAEMALIDAGADDIVAEDGDIVISGPVESLQKIQETAERFGLRIGSASLEWLPKDDVAVEESVREALVGLLEALDDDEDVNAVYCNADV
ncbi:YebC/PmpR family DNA-binding transcriptional regulator [Candidatus Uhrbacteria bacterium]|nr:YebC/PmpR family DNA-binding transcriptional regulator [Candidatus Uhrbacteria bacterium]